MAKTSGTLYLLATPIEELGLLDKVLCHFIEGEIEKGTLIVVEDMKPARRRWRAWGLPRDTIESFISYNEHTRAELGPKLLKSLLEGKNIILMSDGGTPAFCDPGRALVYEVQKKKGRVRVLGLPNSLIAAISLSGLTEGAFEFLGFPPRDKDKRKSFYKDLAKSTGVKAWMDTPYRLSRTIEELVESEMGNREVFIGMDLACEEEELHFLGPIKDLQRVSQSEGWGKREFVCILGPKEGNLS